MESLLAVSLQDNWAAWMGLVGVGIGHLILLGSALTKFSAKIATIETTQRIDDERLKKIEAVIEQQAKVQGEIKESLARISAILENLQSDRRIAR